MHHDSRQWYTFDGKPIRRISEEDRNGRLGLAAVAGLALYAGCTLFFDGVHDRNQKKKALRVVQECLDGSIQDMAIPESVDSLAGSVIHLCLAGKTYELVPETSKGVTTYNVLPSESKQ